MNYGLVISISYKYCMSSFNLIFSPNSEIIRVDLKQVLKTIDVVFILPKTSNRCNFRKCNLMQKDPKDGPFAQGGLFLFQHSGLIGESLWM